MVSAFSRFPVRLQEAIVSRLGWTSLREVQEQASHALLDGKNAIILAPTAGGKTEASVFPMLAQLITDEPDGTGLIYIAPLKALLNNQAERLAGYAEMVGLRCFLWHGDVKPSKKTAYQKSPADILMTTPESLEVMLLSPRVSVQKIFGDLRGVIIDEIHAFAGTDRGAHLISVLERLFRYAKNDVQRVGLSATVGNPEAILEWLSGSSKRPGTIVDPPKPPSKKDIRIHMNGSVNEIAQKASRFASGKKSLFFCQSRSLAESISDKMRDRGMDVFVHHSSVSLEERTEAEMRFHQGSNACIVCTSTLELGIDVGDLDLVLQANAPSTVSAFLQRLGRTGRRESQRANTAFYCETTEAALYAAALVELARSHWVEPVPRKNRCFPVLTHQLFALTLQFGAVSKERCREILSTVPDFSEISPSEYDLLVDHLIEEEFLYEQGGLLSIGDRAEQLYGRKNFMELYSVFTSPQLYKVKTETGYFLGSLEQDFVDTLVEDMSSFLLSGRAWTVILINHNDKAVTVKPAPRGREPSWGGFSPQISGFDICQKIKDILVSESPIPYMDTGSTAALNEMREDLGPMLQGSEPHIQIEPERALWWTFAGGKINFTLKYGIELQTGLKVIADNLRLRIECSGLTFEYIEELLKTMREKSFWNNKETQEKILNALPKYRLSKFQRALPDTFSMELVGNYLMDVDGAVEFLGVQNI